jgi:hypothetical protein
MIALRQLGQVCERERCRNAWKAHLTRAVHSDSLVAIQNREVSFENFENLVIATPSTKRLSFRS